MACTRKRGLPSLPGTLTEVIVQPKFETLTCMVPLLSSKSFGSAIDAQRKLCFLTAQKTS